MKPSRPLFALLLAPLLLYGSVYSARYLRYDRELTAFIGFGCYPSAICWARANGSLLPKRTLVFSTGGYDGQFYYYQAAALLTRAAPVLDAPVLRASRIGFAALVAPFALLSPEALVIALVLAPFALHCLATAALWFYFVRIDNFSLYEKLLGAGLFALNPLSVHAGSLALADGPALSLGLIGAVLFFTRGPARAWRLAGAYCFTLGACLTKETMLALPLGMFGSALLRRAWGDVSFWAASLLPVAGYWTWIGFSPGMAAERGGWPFAGVIEFVGAGEGLGGGRGLLVLLLIAYLLIGLYLAWRGRASDGGAGGGDSHRPGALDLAGVLGATTVLISFATAAEYWANFANISRFFIPGVLPLALLPALSRSGTGDPWPARVCLLLLLFLSGFALSLVLAEWRAAPLPYTIYGDFGVAPAVPFRK